MRLEIKGTSSREYYDEFLYIVFRNRKLRKSPRRKVYQFTKYILIYMICSFFAVVLFNLFYLDTNDGVFLFLTGMLTLLLFILLIYQFTYTKKINLLMENDGVRTVEFNDVGVEYIDDDKNLRIKWEDIKYIIINQYTICILPKVVIDGFTSIDIKYKDKVIETLEKYHKEKLLVDNTGFYNKEDKMEEEKCTCSEDCKCGCQEGKECTCDGSCNESCECGCHENKECTCEK